MLNPIRIWLFTGLFLCAGSLCFGSPVYTLQYKKVTLKNEDKRLLELSEAFGHYIGRNLNNPGIDFDLEKFIKGIRDGSQGTAPPMSDEAYEELMAFYMDKAMRDLALDNQREADNFFQENSKNPAIEEVIANRLQIETLHEGSGESITERSTPLITYSGILLDGTRFDAAEQHKASGDEPFFAGILGMREGESRRIYLHPDAIVQAPEGLPPSTLLIYEVKLICANQADAEVAEEDTLSDLSPNEISRPDMDFKLPEW